MPPADAQELTRHETRSGVLEFEANGYPTDATVARVREEIDYQRAVQAYIHFVPAVAIMQWRNAHLGPLGGKPGDLIVYRTTEQKLPIITANDTTTYVITFAELSDTGGLLQPYGKFAFVAPGSRVAIPEDAVRIELRSHKAKMLARVELQNDRDGAATSRTRVANQARLGMSPGNLLDFELRSDCGGARADL